MANLWQKIAAERRMRELLESERLPQPDSVEYGYASVRLFFEETMTCVVVDIDAGPELNDQNDADIA